MSWLLDMSSAFFASQRVIPPLHPLRKSHAVSGARAGRQTERQKAHGSGRSGIVSPNQPSPPSPSCQLVP